MATAARPQEAVVVVAARRRHKATAGTRGLSLQCPTGRVTTLVWEHLSAQSLAGPRSSFKTGFYVMHNCSTCSIKHSVVSFIPYNFLRVTAAPTDTRAYTGSGAKGDLRPPVSPHPLSPTLLVRGDPLLAILLPEGSGVLGSPSAAAISVSLMVLGPTEAGRDWTWGPAEGRPAELETWDCSGVVEARCCPLDGEPLALTTFEAFSTRASRSGRSNRDCMGATK